jgi:hypothetical protein
MFQSVCYPTVLTQERDPFEFFLRKPSTPSEHSGADSELLNQIEVGPLDVIGDDNRGFLGGKLFNPRYNNAGMIDACEYQLDAAPYRRSNV